MLPKLVVDALKTIFKGQEGNCQTRRKLTKHALVIEQNETFV